MNVLGKYIHANTYFHTLDPRIKIIGMFVMIVALLLPNNFISYSLFLLLIMYALYITKAIKNTLMVIFKTLFFMMILLLLFNCLLMKNGNVLFTIFGIEIYDSAIYNTMFAMLRIVMLLSVSMLLTLTTKPLDLSTALEKMMQPLKKVNFPVNETAMIISIALRFIPVFADEAMKIMKSQTSRGIDFAKGSMKEKMYGLISLVIPLFVSAFQKAEDLANAMEVRGYATDKLRTKYRILKYRTKDYVFILLEIVCIVVILGVSYAI